MTLSLSPTQLKKIQYSAFVFFGFPQIMNPFIILLTLVLPSTLAITNDPPRRDSYMSAYMDLQGSTESSAGVVYAEPLRTYGPPQPKPLVYYGPPAVHAPIPVDHHTYAAEYSYAPLIDILMKLPEKLDFLPKFIAGFLGITKILLKVVLLKMILKFIVMFCLFFFLPKLSMLESATDVELTNASPANNTGPHTPVDGENEILSYMFGFYFTPFTFFFSFVFRTRRRTFEQYHELRTRFCWEAVVSKTIL